MGTWDKVQKLVEDIARQKQQGYTNSPIKPEKPQLSGDVNVSLTKSNWYLVQDALGTLITIQPDSEARISEIMREISSQLKRKGV